MSQCDKCNSTGWVYDRYGMPCPQCRPRCKKCGLFPDVPNKPTHCSCATSARIAELEAQVAALMDVARSAAAYCACKVDDTRLQPDIEADGYFSQLTYSLDEADKMMRGAK